MLDSPARFPHHYFTVFNSTDRFGDLCIEADTRHIGGFFTSVRNTIGTSSSMAGLGGDTFGYAGSSMPVRQPRHAPATPIWRWDAGLQTIEEATMPSITLRAFRALFPKVTRPVSTLPNEAQARALAALLVAQGQRALIHRTAAGFAVEVIA
ncbi:hypothetical protein CBW21_01110 [Chromobacterium violaceum]|uniref:Uncharacterized protein n=2 Tax=Chromobacterium TaxID=535 RepID=A0A202BGM2_CHRVL|nr:hypothetical protein CBW21_01110 [Chromobacterium violaceum]